MKKFRIKLEIFLKESLRNYKREGEKHKKRFSKNKNSETSSEDPIPYPDLNQSFKSL